MVLITLIFSLLRPRNSVVYAPKLKYADEKHAPPEIGKSLFAWFTPVNKTTEAQLVEKVGLDGTVFLRFTRMCRNMFLVLSIVSIGVLIPANTLGSTRTSWTPTASKIFVTMSGAYIKPTTAWAHVFSAYAVDLIMAYFLWRNYVAITRLRRQYFESADYMTSLHSRTLMITDIPTSSRTDEGILKLLDGVVKSDGFTRTSIGRNVKELPDLVEEHETAVRELESVLAKYLKNPDHLPSARPTLRPPKTYRRNNGGEKVDAIDYLTARIRELESEIVHIRESIDRRNPMPYGFASYETIEEAHTVAFASKSKHPRGTTIKLAPTPSDLIWQNLPLSKRARRWKRFVNNIWITLLTIVWIVPNALIAIFLANLNNLARVWPAFEKNLKANPNTWSIVQGIASPALLSLVYLILPIIFRRLCSKAGDFTKTSRERHVITKLYAFFVFNNLIIFSLFGAMWTFVTTVIQGTETKSVQEALREAKFIEKTLFGLATVAPFWLTWLLQRNLGAAIDLAQVISLSWIWFVRTFRNPTPRQAIEWTAPPPFEYAVYFNYFLFYSTVALAFVTLQPLVIPITAFYFTIDYWLKKYQLLYVFVTKNESGGQFWRVIFNRLIFAVILSNLIIAVVVKAQGTWTQIFSMVPLPILMGAFKWYCARTFDNQISYYNKAALKDPQLLPDANRKPRQNDRVAKKFGHPALYKKLITPMVYEKSQHVLRQVYSGRLNIDGAANPTGIAMDSMSRSQTGKAAHFAPTGPRDLFEVVPESQLDFAHFKDRADFSEGHGGGGAIYGTPLDLISERSGTPKSFLGAGSDSNPSSRASSVGPIGRPRNQRAPSSLGFEDLGSPGLLAEPRGRDLYRTSNESQRTLLAEAQHPGHDGFEHDDPGAEQYGVNRWRPGGSGYVGVSSRPGTPDESFGYDSYRGRK